MRKKPPAETALYVRIPTTAVEKLDRAAEVLGVHKKDLVAGLVTRYVDPDSRHGLNALGTLSQSRRITLDIGGEPSPTLGSYSFQPYDPPEVLTAEQAGELLQLTASVVVELAEAGTIPGRKLGPAWRFSRTALIAWLSNSERP